MILQGGQVHAHVPPCCILQSKKVNYAGDDADDGQEGSEYEGCAVA